MTLMKSQSQESAFVVEERITQTYHKGKSFWQVVSAYQNGWVQICLNLRKGLALVLKDKRC